DNVFVKNKINLKAAIKFQYDTYFEIVGGAQLLRASNFPFFQDTTTQGVFDINISEQVTKVAGFLNLLFHLGPNGVLYSESELQLTKEDDGNYIPYNPFFWNQTSYGYYFDFGLNARIKSHVSIGTYTDIQNTVKLPMYFNLALEFGYKLSDNFTITLNLENLLNKKNYIYKNYKEKPIDAILGFSYYW
ncbi:MAG: TonB-dependent receptor, partial [Ignavibacteriales bacterium]|nr:TonB-dependent receptor [Ignavibacteriales bacterium]